MSDSKLKLRHGRKSPKYLSHAIYLKHTHTQTYTYVYVCVLFNTMPVEVYFSRNRASLSGKLITWLIGPLSSVDKILSCESLELDKFFSSFVFRHRGTDRINV
jgi:hypothetical protein